MKLLRLNRSTCVRVEQFYQFRFAFLGLSMADFQFCLLLFEISPIASEQRSILGFGCRNFVSRNQGTVANCRQLLLTQISGVHESLPIFCKNTRKWRVLYIR